LTEELSDGIHFSGSISAPSASKCPQGSERQAAYPVLRPIREHVGAADHPFYRLDEMAVSTAKPVRNEEIDRIVYEP
jgi:hypothetical protein